ncbi:hypothetical protein LOK49_LG10G02946 [Camellia lanceoleosa]|uniref:Uncharacterized protein n=1 Tax=Camellia lanceoleosa TaxID=1840588 RepID=A0ACC0G6T9_9ERIC|nr:hypothetical protein LOK49_LG10G02946 [Camellia lanceoleosa]
MNIEILLHHNIFYLLSIQQPTLIKKKKNTLTKHLKISHIKIHSMPQESEKRDNQRVTNGAGNRHRERRTGVRRRCRSHRGILSRDDGGGGHEEDGEDEGEDDANLRHE